MSAKIHFCVGIRKDLADGLLQVAKDRGTSRDELMDSILSGYLNVSDKFTSNKSGDDRRRHKRAIASMPAMLEMKTGQRETQFKPVIICNISRGGLGLQMEMYSEAIMESIECKMPFSITFCIPGFSDIVRMTCRPVYAAKKAPLEFGATFLSSPSPFQSMLHLAFRL